MIPYFSIINTPAGMILFAWGIIIMAFVGAGSGYISHYVEPEDKRKNSATTKMFALALISVSLHLICVWLMIGDSTSWSAPIGDWFTGEL